MKKQFKKTRIIATIGPSSESPDVLARLQKAGLDVGRLNFSHGSHGEHAKRIAAIRATEKKTKQSIAILADLAGPKIRTGDLATPTVTLVPGKRLVLTTKNIEGTAERMSVNYPGLPKDLSPGSQVLINDGKQRLHVDKISGTEITCTVEVGGTIRARRGLNLPGTKLSLSAFTEKDLADVRFCVPHGVDAFALSFVQSAEDIHTLRNHLTKLRSKALIMAKIETESAIENLDAIIDAADAVMVARGDLAVEVGAERVPFLQKTIVKKARAKGKIVVVATQMLESMISAPVPTRAEVSDVANAILEGADAVMLSAESAVGEFPEEAVAMLSKIADETELHVDHKKRTRRAYSYGEARTISIVDAITRYAAKTAMDISARVIVTLTETGATARMVGRYRTQQPLVVVSRHEHTLRQASFLFGAHALSMPLQKDMDAVMKFLRRALVKEGYVKKGDRIVLVSGLNIGTSGGTNSVSAFRI